MEEVLDYENESLKLAGKGARFANYLIDAIIYGGALGYLSYSNTMTYMEMVQNDPEALMAMDPMELQSQMSVTGSTFGDIFLNLGIMVGYYALCEGLLKGRTIGKFVTGTKAVKKDGSDISFGQAIGRSFARLIPFEPLSVLFGKKGWHDTIPGTMVVKAK